MNARVFGFEGPVGGSADFDVRKEGVGSVFSAGTLSVADGDRNSEDNPSQPTLDATNKVFAAGDVLVVDCDSLPATPGKGYTIYIEEA